MMRITSDVLPSDNNSIIKRETVMGGHHKGNHHGEDWPQKVEVCDATKTHRAPSVIITSKKFEMTAIIVVACGVGQSGATELACEWAPDEWLNFFSMLP